MKRLGKIGLLAATFGLAGCIGLGLGLGLKSNPVMVRADEPEISEPEDLHAVVEIEKGKHFKVEADILEGEEGDICNLDVSPEFLYLVKSVTVNGTALIENETTSGLYSFALVRGVNVVSVSVVVNEELLGELSTIYAQMRDKDWSNLFTVENVITLVKWVLDCGILIAIIRYYIRDKRLAAKVEKATKESVEKIIPESTKQAVVATIREVLEPIFAQLKADNIELSRAMSAFAKCMALAQENTPESRTAIIDILSNLKISDEKTLADVKAYIDRLFAEHIATVDSVIKSLDNIGVEEEPVDEEPTEQLPLPDVGDGTSI